VIEATEEAVLSSMINAGQVCGFNGNVRKNLREYLKQMQSDI
jgi:L-aminopeptidase/D-esterase-like protein